jgi:hypothetical protein
MADDPKVVAATVGDIGQHQRLCRIAWYAVEGGMALHRAPKEHGVSRNNEKISVPPLFHQNKADTPHIG